MLNQIDLFQVLPFRDAVLELLGTVIEGVFRHASLFLQVFLFITFFQDYFRLVGQVLNRVLIIFRHRQYPFAHNAADCRSDGIGKRRTSLTPFILFSGLP